MSDPHVVTVGRLVSVEYLRRGKLYRLAFKGPAWLCWWPERDDLIVTTRVPGYASVDPHAETAKMHKTFHRSEPRGAMPVSWHEPERPMRRLGLAHALTYRVPASFGSKKQRNESGALTDWRHEFGEDAPGKVDRSDTRMPGLDVDARGRFFLTRLPGNRYTLDEWLVG